MERPAPLAQQTLIGIGVLVVAVLLAAGAAFIPSEAGYSGVGPNFLPWAAAVALAACGAFLLWERYSGGWRNVEEPSGAEHGDWRGFAWVSAGLLANALLITHIGFILSCTVCFALAVRGLRLSEGKVVQRAAAGVPHDLAVGALISAPVFWMFTKVLSINLPGLTASGWI